MLIGALPVPVELPPVHKAPQIMDLTVSTASTVPTAIGLADLDSTMATTKTESSGSSQSASEKHALVSEEKENAPENVPEDNAQEEKAPENVPDLARQIGVSHLGVRVIRVSRCYA